MNGKAVGAHVLFKRAAGGCEAAGDARLNYIPGAARLIRNGGSCRVRPLKRWGISYMAVPEEDVSREGAPNRGGTADFFRPLHSHAEGGFLFLPREKR